MLIHVTDWLPTFMKFSRGKVPEEVDGYDQWEALENNNPERNEFIYNLNDEKLPKATIR